MLVVCLAIDMRSGLALLKQYLKKIEIKVDKTNVYFTQIFDLGSEELAIAFAKSLKKQFEG